MKMVKIINANGEEREVTELVANNKSAMNAHGFRLKPEVLTEAETSVKPEDKKADKEPVEEREVTELVDINIEFDPLGEVDSNQKKSNAKANKQNK